MNVSDIVFYHSGDGTNCDPASDLGGNRSTCAIADSINNLFDDLSAKKSREGLIDYRCFYVKNDHADDILRNAKLYVSSERKSGSFIEIGIKQVNEVQKLRIQGTKPPNEGEYMVLQIPSYSSNIIIYYHINPTIWQGMFQTEVRGVDGLRDVLVSVAGTIGFPTDITFTLTFIGSSGNRDIDLLSVVDHNLDGQTLTPSEYTKGYPVNTTATTVANKTTAPAGITFDYPLLGSPVLLGDLKPEDEFPVWIRRTTPANTLIGIKDDFLINVDGTFP